MGRHGGHVTKRGVLWEDMVDTLWTRNKERSPMGRHGGHVALRVMGRHGGHNKERSPMGRHGGHVVT